MRHAASSSSVLRKKRKSYLTRVERSLKKGKLPRLNRHYLGMEELLKKYNVTDDMVYIPLHTRTDKENALECRRWWDRNRYKEQRRSTGEYKSQEERKLEFVDKSVTDAFLSARYK